MPNPPELCNRNIVLTPALYCSVVRVVSNHPVPTGFKSKVGRSRGNEGVGERLHGKQSEKIKKDRCGEEG